MVAFDGYESSMVAFYKSFRPEMFYKIGALKNLVKIHRKMLVPKSFFR